MKVKSLQDLKALQKQLAETQARAAKEAAVRAAAEQKARGVVTASAGNHAQGVALAAKELGIKARIVMPCSTPELKVLGVRSRGAEAV